MSQERLTNMLVTFHDDVAHVLLDKLSVKEHEVMAVTASELEELLTGRSYCKIVVDLEQVDYLSSAMLGNLIRLSRKTAHQKQRLRICGLGGGLVELFETTRLNTHPDFALFDTSEGALASFDA